MPVGPIRIRLGESSCGPLLPSLRGLEAPGHLCQTWRFSMSTAVVGLGASQSLLRSVKWAREEGQAMATAEGPVVVCSFVDRDHAAEIVAGIRKGEIPVAVVPSDHRDGAWDVMVRGCDATYVMKLVEVLLAPS